MGNDKRYFKKIASVKKNIVNKGGSLPVIENHKIWVLIFPIVGIKLFFLTDAALK